jgi:hypothetical protein
MTQYLMSVHYVEGTPATPPEEMQKAYEAVDKFNAELKEAGRWVFGGGLTEPSDATVVDNTRGQAMITDGPFAEAKEQIGGFWVIEAADLDEALDLAKQASAACFGPVEVRPFQDEPPVEG